MLSKPLFTTLSVSIPALSCGSVVTMEGEGGCATTGQCTVSLAELDARQFYSERWDSAANALHLIVPKHRTKRLAEKWAANRCRVKTHCSL